MDNMAVVLKTRPVCLDGQTSSNDPEQIKVSPLLFVEISAVGNVM